MASLLSGFSIEVSPSSFSPTTSLAVGPAFAGLAFADLALAGLALADDFEEATLTAFLGEALVALALVFTFCCLGVNAWGRLQFGDEKWGRTVIS